MKTGKVIMLLGILLPGPNGRPVDVPFALVSDGTSDYLVREPIGRNVGDVVEIPDGVLPMQPGMIS